MTLDTSCVHAIITTIRFNADSKIGCIGYFCSKAKCLCGRGTSVGLISICMLAKAVNFLVVKFIECVRRCMLAEAVAESQIRRWVHVCRKASCCDVATFKSHDCANDFRVGVECLSFHVH